MKHGEHIKQKNKYTTMNSVATTTKKNGQTYKPGEL